MAETRGNPLALLELPRGLSPGELAGGFGLPGAVPLDARIEDSFRRQLNACQSRPGGWCCWRRPTRPAMPHWCGGPPGGWGSRCRRPGRRWSRGWQSSPAGCGSGILARSAAYRSASLPERQEMHGALAAATDAQADPDRRAWHRAARFVVTTSRCSRSTASTMPATALRTSRQRAIRSGSSVGAVWRVRRRPTVSDQSMGWVDSSNVSRTSLADLEGAGYARLSSSTGMVRIPAVWRAYSAKPG